jgi:hypothetical protein
MTVVADAGHLTEQELARGRDEPRDPEQAAHLSWCRRCGGLAAEYRWQESEVSVALSAVARRVPLPVGCWPRTQAGLIVARRREQMARHFYAVLTCLCAMCLILLATPLGRISVATPELASAALRVPAPSTQVASHYRANLPEPLATPASTDQPIELRPVPEPMGAPCAQAATTRIP